MPHGDGAKQSQQARRSPKLLLGFDMASAWQTRSGHRAPVRLVVLSPLSRIVPHGYRRLLSMPRAWLQRHLHLTR